MALFKKSERGKAIKNSGQIGRTSFLAKIGPRKGYHFFSDYFEIDDGYATILTIFNKAGADRHLPPMWGINLIPRGLGAHVTSRLLMQVNVAPPKWVESHQVDSDNRTVNQNREAVRSSKSKDQKLAQYRTEDMKVIADDLSAGDSYMYVTFKLLVKAPTLEELDLAVDRINRRYGKLFSQVRATTFEGQQRDDVMHLFEPASAQIGHPYMFSASELAGNYNLVTHGISDEMGDYVGIMQADVNNTAILWDVDDFTRNVVIASDSKAAAFSANVHYDSTVRGATMWGVKLAQAALTNNHRVVHLVLNNAQVQNIGADLSDITAVISMNKGAINPFEMFGDPKDELMIFPAHTNKLRLMAKQMSPSLNDIDLQKNFSKIINDFYVDQGMWRDDAQHHRDQLRIVGLPHDQVPRLRMFKAYLEEAHTAAENQNQTSKANSIEKLQGVFDVMVQENSDLFDVTTSSRVDGASVMPQVIYDFSSLYRRGKGVEMAQFVNALGYATNSLESGDLLIIHGADQIDSQVHQYVQDLLGNLQTDDVRVAFLYDSIDKMLDDTKLNRFNEADYVLTGYMSQATINKYMDLLEMDIPPALKSSIQTKDPRLYYLRRGFDNVIFAADVALDIPQNVQSLM